MAKTVKDLMAEQKYVKLELGQKIRLQIAKDPLATEARKNNYGKQVVDWEFKDENGKDKVLTTGSQSILRTMARLQVGDWVIAEMKADDNQFGKKMVIYAEKKGNGAVVESAPATTGELPTIDLDAKEGSDLPF